MPPEMADPDGDGVVRFDDYDAPRRRWWRPAGPVGRAVIGVCALLALGVVTVAVVSLKTYIERDNRFRIAGSSDIQTAGLAEVSRAQLLPVFGEDIGRNVFFVPLDARRKQLEAIPWIQQATVMRLLPDQIRVAVVERKPVAFVREGSRIELVDPNGVLLDMDAATMAQRHYSFPVLTGIDPADPAAARKARMDLYLRLMHDLDAGGQRNSEQISEIDLTDPEDARVVLPEQGTDILAHFGQDHFLERFQRYQAHIAEWRQQYPQLSAVDLRYDHQVVLQMSSGATDTKPSADGTAQATGSAASTAKPAQKPAASASHAAKHKTTAAERRRELERRKRAEARRAALLRNAHRHAQQSMQTSVVQGGE